MTQSTTSSRAQHLLPWLGAAAGAALIGVGLFVPSVLQWRVLLLVGLWLVFWPARASIRRHVQIVASRNMLLLAALFGMGFAAVGLQLARTQIVQASAIREQAAAIFAPATAAEPDETILIRPVDRTALGTGRVWPVDVGSATRGSIRDRNGTVLAENRDGRRFYPDPAMGQITGYASRLFGTSGVEDTFDRYLSGNANLDAESILRARLVGTSVPTASADLTMTIDSRLQQVAQQALGDRRGAVALLDPRSGAILALASYPRFDPNQLVLGPNASQADVDTVQAAWQSLIDNPDSPLLNRAAVGRYPPGSVIKTFTAAAALDAGVLSGPEAQVTCPNRLQTENGAPPVRNAVENLSGRTGDPSDLRRVFAFSCNTAFAQIGLALGAQRFAEYATRFGMPVADAANRTPDIRDLSIDVASMANTAAFLDRPAALADTAYGQGQALVSPLDMAQMVALIGNDGKLMRPYLVQEARAGDQALYTATPEVLRQVISAQAAGQMRAVMKTSVEIGYAAPVALSGVNIGAKTGTAETPTGDPHSWFVALAPVEQPQYAIAVIVENGGEGSRSALPVARQVLAAALGVQQ